VLYRISHILTYLLKTIDATSLCFCFIISKFSLGMSPEDNITTVQLEDFYGVKFCNLRARGDGSC